MDSWLDLQIREARLRRFDEIPWVNEILRDANLKWRPSQLFEDDISGR